MFIRVFIIRFPTAAKAKLLLNFIQAQEANFINKSDIASFSVMDIGEGKLLNVAKYESKEDFEKTNKWLSPIFLEAVDALDGRVESIPGEVLLHYENKKLTLL